jgi:hypothetical protein
MSRLRAVLDRLGDIESTIDKIERAYATERSLALSLSLKSLESRRDMLRGELAEISSYEFIDVCDYKFVPEGIESYALTGITSALQQFQEMISFIYSSVTRTVQQSVKLSRETIEKTQFNFGFSHSGSLGIVLTMKNDRLMLVESDIERSISSAFGIMKAKTADDIKVAAANYGVPSVRKLYKWSKTHRDYGMAADIKWFRGSEAIYEVFVQSQELADICAIIEKKSDKFEESLSVSGILTAWNVPRRTFLLEFPEGESISGQWAKEFDGSVTREIPARYRADLIKETVIHYASEEDDTKWYLVNLRNETNPPA